MSVNYNDIFLEKVCNLDIDNFINYCSTNNIPMYICLIKIVKILSKTCNKEDIISIIKSFDLIGNLVNDEQLVLIIDEYSSNILPDDVTDIKYFNIENFKKSKLSANVNDNLIYPKPVFKADGSFSRTPNLYEYRCLHEDCGECFIEIIDLVRHLQQKSRYTQGWHLAHIKRYSYALDRILEMNITRCEICKFVGTSVLDMIDHLCVVGIEGFCTNIEEYNAAKQRIANKGVDIESSQKIFTSNECVICWDKKPETLLFPCRHNIFCMKCIMGKNVCPMCQQKINFAINF